MKTITGRIIPCRVERLPPKIQGEELKEKKELETLKVDKRHLKGARTRRIIGLLAKDGVSTGEIARSLNMHPDAVSRNKGVIRDNLLTKPATVKRAIKTVTSLMKGKPVGTHKIRVFKDGKTQDVEVSNDLPSPGVSLNAAKEVLDRAYPKIQKTESVNLDLSSSVVDLSQYATQGVGTVAQRDSDQTIDVDTVEFDAEGDFLS